MSKKISSNLSEPEAMRDWEEEEQENIVGIGQLDENNLRDSGLLLMYNPDGVINIDDLVENMRFSFFPDDPIFFRYYKAEAPNIGIDTGGTAEEIVGKLREEGMSNLVRIRAWLWIDHKPDVRRWGEARFLKDIK